MSSRSSNSWFRASEHDQGEFGTLGWRRAFVNRRSGEIKWFGCGEVGFNESYAQESRIRYMADLIRRERAALRRAG